jgi:hypothetical protein
MHDPASELPRISIRNCLKRGLSNAPRVDLAGISGPKRAE